MNIRTLTHLILLYSTLSIIVPSGARAMSFLSVGKTCVFSEVKAVLTRDGEPLKNIEVIRKWEWKELKEEKTHTDENGVFTFPAVFESSATRLLPIELVIGQALFVKENNVETKFWSHSKRKPEENSEFNGKPIDLICELNNELKIYDHSGSTMRTLCSWEKDNEQ